MKWNIDINCDLGEGAENDEKIMPLINSCNIACGGHYGTDATIEEAVTLAKKYGIKVGAHPSFPDPINFGRVVMEIDSETLKKSIIEQVQRFQKITAQIGLSMSHVKLHGALYNQAAKNINVAQTVIEALLQVGTDYAIYAPHDSALEQVGQAHFAIIPEVFIDRTYQADGSLTPRSQANAMIIDPLKAWNQIKNCYLNNKVEAVTNESIHMKGKTYCIHGDASHCLEILYYIKDQLAHA